MPPTPSNTKISKFTRGEKCLFIHLIITIVIILVMIITYIVHLCVVKHTRDDVFKIYRRSFDPSVAGLSDSDARSIGVVFLNMTPPTIVCVTLLLGEKWSLAPAQCTSMREDPDMSNYILQWKIKYKIDGIQIHSDIKRSLTHSHFNRGDYHNNIGLFEHVEKIFNKRYYVAPKNILVNDEMLENYENQMAIVDWEFNFSKKGDVSGSIANAVRPIFSNKCSVYANAIVEKIRPYEFCVTFEKNGPIAAPVIKLIAILKCNLTCIMRHWKCDCHRNSSCSFVGVVTGFDGNVCEANFAPHSITTYCAHGAMLVINSTIIGFFTWGDVRGEGVPLIILNILHFREWFESILSL